jgi:hypothetical protein
MPVIMFDHATGLCGGMLVPSLTKLPSAASAAKLGILPASISPRRISGSMPSMPSTTTFGASTVDDS